MFTAFQKKRENIVEYILYMWQIEDLLRACKFDEQEIENNIIEKYKMPETQLLELRKWYSKLAETMHSEGIDEKGHLQSVTKIVGKLNKMHHDLLTVAKNEKYQHLYTQASENIQILKNKNNKRDDVEVCLDAIYGFYILRLQNKKISDDTIEAVTTLSAMLSYLSQIYHTSQN